MSSPSGGGKTEAFKLMGGGLSETRDQVRRAQDPEEAKAQESIELAGRLNPVPPETDSGEVSDPGVDRYVDGL
jgi:hypothetical protein